MTAGVTIGEFSRLCHLSAKTLRHYHDIELLVPAGVDGTGYRRYRPARSATRTSSGGCATWTCRWPRSVGARRTGTAARQDALARHLDRMEAELTRTRDVVASLRRLLGPEPELPVTAPPVAGAPVLRMSARLARDRGRGLLPAGLPVDVCGSWRPRHRPGRSRRRDLLGRVLRGETGEVVAFVPVAARRYRPATTVSASYRRALRHRRPRRPIRRLRHHLRTARPGHVAEHDVALPDPIVELYLVGPDQTDDPEQFQTEICWPINPGA